MASQSLTLQQQQQLRLSPQQLLVQSLVGLQTLELEERINKEIEENPALDVEYSDVKESQTSDNEYDDVDDEYIDSDDDFGVRLSHSDYTIDDDGNSYYNDSDDRNLELLAEPSLIDSLIVQIHNLRTLSDKEVELSEYVVGNLDDSGFLKRSVENMTDDYVFTFNKDVSDEQMSHAVSIVQSLDPPGIGAKDIRECMLLQLRRKRQTEPVVLAITALEQYYDDLESGMFDRLSKKLKIDSDMADLMIKEFRSLSPRPAVSGYSADDRSLHITPDFIVRNEDGELILELNDANVPSLKVSTVYGEMLNNLNNSGKMTKSQREAVTFVKQKIDSARWFISAIQQRKTTLTNVMTSIMEIQKEYFFSGDELLLKPMVLKDIAQKTGYDVSTISRVCNSKFVQTDFGTFLLKHFFSESSQCNDGKEVSTRHLKVIIKELIDNEDKKNPLSDGEILELMAKKGLTIARRTVAKYREQMGIPRLEVRKKM